MINLQRRLNRIKVLFDTHNSVIFTFPWFHQIVQNISHVGDNFCYSHDDKINFVPLFL